MTAVTESEAEGEAAPVAPYDVETIRTDFPILFRDVYGKPLVYLDNGASAQKPRSVIDAIDYAYKMEYANVHRGLHFLSNAATSRFEDARETVRRFLNAPSTDEIIFTRNLTDGVNLVASSFGMDFKKGDEIVISIMEHHSNIVPWHFHRERKGCVIKWAPISDQGDFLIDEFEALLTKRTKIVAITHMSNVLGTVVPIKEVIRRAHARGIPVLVDGAQAAVHMPIDVQDLDCDFYAFTGHKTYGPSGIGVLYAKKKHLEAMPPYQGGGDMIESVHTDRVVYGKPPHKFEAGTPPIVQAIGLGAALDYMMQVGRERIAAHEAELRDYAHERLSRLNWLEDSRHREGQGGDRLVLDRRPAPPRHLHHHRPLGRGGAGGPSLRPAADGPARRHGDMPGLVRHVQHQGRGRRPGRSADQGARLLLLMHAVSRPMDSKPAVDVAIAEPAPVQAKPEPGSSIPPEQLEQLTADIVAALKTVYDPEIPADIYELGLIYKIDVDDDRNIAIDMTLTAPGCPVAGEMPVWVENAVAAVPGVGQVKVKLTFDPPWDKDRMSDEAKLALGMF